MESENMVLVLLREILAKQDELSTKLDKIEARVLRVSKQIEDLRMAVTHSPGPSAETQARGTQQSAGIDELFAQLEKVNTGKLQ